MEQVEEGWEGGGERVMGWDQYWMDIHYVSTHLAVSCEKQKSQLSCWAPRKNNFDADSHLCIVQGLCKKEEGDC